MTSYRLAHLAALASGTVALATATAAVPIVAELSPAEPVEDQEARPEPVEVPS